MDEQELFFILIRFVSLFTPFCIKFVERRPLSSSSFVFCFSRVCAIKRLWLITYSCKTIHIHVCASLFFKRMKSCGKLTTRIHKGLKIKILNLSSLFFRQTALFYHNSNAVKKHVKYQGSILA